MIFLLRSPFSGWTTATLIAVAGTLSVARADSFVQVPPLSSHGLAAPKVGDTRRMQLFDQDGDGRTDLSALRIEAQDGDETFIRPLQLDIWLRRDLLNGEAFQYDLSPYSRGYETIFDIQPLFLPAVPAGAQRVVASLGFGRVWFFPVRSTLNPQPGGSVALSPTLPATLPFDSYYRPEWRRLHYPPRGLIRPGELGYVAYPLVVSARSGRAWVLHVENDGRITLVEDPLLHPDDVRDAIVFGEPNGGPPAIITLGTGLPRLWRRNGDGYVDQLLPLDGLAATDLVVRGILGEFTRDGFPDLVAATSDGRVLRWDGVAPVDAAAPLRFGPAQTVASGLLVHDMVEVRLPGPVIGRYGVILAAEPESRFYAADVALPGAPFGPPIQRFAPGRAVVTDDGLVPQVFLARADSRIVHLEYSSDEPAPAAIRWQSLDPVPMLTDGNVGIMLLGLESERPQPGPAIVWVYPGPPGGTGVYEIEGDNFTVGAGERYHLLQFRTLPNAAMRQPFDLVLSTALPVSGPLRRPAYPVSASCGECLADCFNGAGVVGITTDAGGKVQRGKALVDPIGMTTLRRFRDEVLAASPKGRDYTAMYREFSGDAFRTLVVDTKAIANLVRARDAWLPAIARWVEGDRSAPITAEMLETLDLVAQTLVVRGSPGLAATVRAEYQRLDPGTLAGGSIVDLDARLESTPTRAILRSGFEATTTAQ